MTCLTALIPLHMSSLFLIFLTNRSQQLHPRLFDFSYIAPQAKYEEEVTAGLKLLLKLCTLDNVI
jgi:hypothetical protein